MNDLEKLTTATKMLAEVSSAKDAWDLSRTAEAARQYAQLRNLGHESINYATGIKAKAMVMLADLVDAGQETGTIASVGRPSVKDSVEEEIKPSSLVDLGIGDNANQAAKAVHEARRLRESLGGQDIDALIREANDHGEDLGLRGLRRLAADKRIPEAVSKPIPLPTGKFSCVTMDPPWPMKKMPLDKFPDQGKELDYPTMPVFCKEGKCLREDCGTIQCLIGRILDSSADDNCHLYVWVTHRFLPDGIQLVKSWGFHYQCLMTWVKPGGMTPFSWMYNTEHVIFAHRGNLEVQRKGMKLSFEASNRGHSVKPEVFYERVMEASPEPRLEIFAREPRSGFTVWGNQV